MKRRLPSGGTKKGGAAYGETLLPLTAAAVTPPAAAAASSSAAAAMSIAAAAGAGHHNRNSRRHGSKQQRSKFSGIKACILISGSVVTFVFVVVLLFKLRATGNGGDDEQPDHRAGGGGAEITLPFYTPTILDEDAITADDWPWREAAPLIHIVKTRFMQEQGGLAALGAARLGLFRTFCLPTVRRQSTQHFLWIIKTDPDLDARLLSELVRLVQSDGGTAVDNNSNNTYIVASNTNFRVNENFPGGWRDGAEGRDLAASRVYTGDRKLLEAAMALQDRLPVLETRLDADDGLHKEFLQFVQRDALKQFAAAAPPQQQQQQQPPQQPPVQWMYWCSKRIIEWHWMDPLQPNLPFAEDLATMTYRYGAVQGVKHTHLCITPGITTGFAVPTREADVPIFAHDELAKKLYEEEEDGGGDQVTPGCGKPKKSDCLKFVEGFVFEAVRSRAPTSAGMLRMQAVPKELHPEWWVNYAFWNMLHEAFGLQRPQLQWMQQYLSDHLMEIARDNLMGQCTTGHSCKEKARKALEELLASRSNSTTTLTQTANATTAEQKERHLR